MATPTAPASRVTAEALAVVVRAQAYLDALVSGDCERAKTMVTDESLVWCPKPKVTEYLINGSPSVAIAGQKSADGWCVPVDITVTDTDVSLPEGRHQWGYCFTRRNGEWLLFDQGVI